MSNMFPNPRLPWPDPPENTAESESKAVLVSQYSENHADAVGRLEGYEEWIISTEARDLDEMR
jgi:hypothetical protein